MGEAAAAAPGVLQQLSAGILSAKTKAAAGLLTPVKGEAPPSLIPTAPLAEAQPVAFPYDSPEMIQGALRDARLGAEFILKGIVMLEAVYGVREEAGELPKNRNADERYETKVAPPATISESPMKALGEAIVAEDKEAAEEFADRIARLQAEAQAATFAVEQGAADPEDVAPIVSIAAIVKAIEEGWQCSVHGQHEVRKAKRSGREFRACPVCGNTDYNDL